MAHTIPYALVFPTHLVDALDAAWLKDELPDDGEWWWWRERERAKRRPPCVFILPSFPSSSDVPLPDGVDPPVEPDAGDVGGGETGPAEEDRWGELGLQELT